MFASVCLNAQNQVVPAANATSNRVYALTSAEHRRAPSCRWSWERYRRRRPVSRRTPGNAQVSLAWNAVSGATGYNVKRSTTNGGPYANVGANVTTDLVHEHRPHQWHALLLRRDGAERERREPDRRRR